MIVRNQYVCKKGRNKNSLIYNPFHYIKSAEKNQKIVGRIFINSIWFPPEKIGKRVVIKVFETTANTVEEFNKAETEERMKAYARGYNAGYQDGQKRAGQ